MDPPQMVPYDAPQSFSSRHHASCLDRCQIDVRSLGRVRMIGRIGGRRETRTARGQTACGHATRTLHTVGHTCPSQSTMLIPSNQKQPTMTRKRHIAADAPCCRARFKERRLEIRLSNSFGWAVPQWRIRWTVGPELDCVPVRLRIKSPPCVLPPHPSASRTTPRTHEHSSPL